jgi:hypothetical protein
MKLYALMSSTGDCFTNHGRLIVHDSREEMEWLVPGYVAREVSSTALPTVPLSDLPGIVGVVQFPLNRDDFRRTEQWV